MEYRKFKDTIIVRFNRNEEIIEQLMNLIKKENIKLGMVNALGATNKFTVGVYSVEEKKYYSKEYTGAYEIVSLHGNISTMNGEPYLHLHMSCAGEDGITVGGHLNSCIISATCEMFITLIDGSVDRIKDTETGLNIYKFN